MKLVARLNKALKLAVAALLVQQSLLAWKIVCLRSRPTADELFFECSCGPLQPGGTCAWLYSQMQDL